MVKVLTRGRRRATTSVAAGVLVAAFATAACTDDGGETAAPSPSSMPGPLPPLRTIFPGDLVALQTVPWHAARVVSETEFDILYDGSPVECRQLANVRVAEAASTVTITVFEGQPRSSARQVCPGIAESARVRVTLRTPLGTRRLLDGDAKPPAERAASR